MRAIFANGEINLEAGGGSSLMGSPLTTHTITAGNTPNHSERPLLVEKYLDLELSPTMSFKLDRKSSRNHKKNSFPEIPEFGQRDLEGK